MAHYKMAFENVTTFLTDDPDFDDEVGVFTINIEFDAYDTVAAKAALQTIFGGAFSGATVTVSDYTPEG